MLITDRPLLKTWNGLIKFRPRKHPKPDRFFLAVFHLVKCQPLVCTRVKKNPTRLEQCKRATCLAHGREAPKISGSRGQITAETKQPDSPHQATSGFVPRRFSFYRVYWGKLRSSHIVTHYGNHFFVRIPLSFPAQKNPSAIYALLET